MDASEFDADRQIDPGQLDLEAARQADVFFKWAERSVSARADVDRAKLKLEWTEAKLSLACREKPEDFGLGKATEASITAAVKVHEDYQAAFDRWIRAKENSALLDKAVEAMEQRKRMLEVLITLHGQQYFAGPSVPRDLVGAWQAEQERREQRVNKRVAGASGPVRKKVRRIERES